MRNTATQDPKKNPLTKPGQYRHGDARADGRRFVTYAWRKDIRQWTEIWSSPAQWEHRAQKRRVTYWFDPPADSEPPKHELKYWRGSRPRHGDADSIPIGYKHESGWMFAGWRPDSGGWSPRWCRPSELMRLKASRKAREARPGGYVLLEREVMPDGTIHETWIPPKFASLEETEVGKLMKSRRGGGK